MIPKLVTSISLGALLASSAFAQSSTEFATLHSELARLRQDQQATAARIDAIEVALNRIAGKPATTALTTPQPSPAQIPPSVVASVAPILSKLALSGDLRVRYEANFGDNDARDRHREVMRARLRASYAVADWLTVGGELDTGDPDDPNSTDVTLSGFDDDFAVNLSQAYIRGTFGRLQVQAGKFALPFTRTDLVWDGDVNPDGLSATYTLPVSSALKMRATGLYFVIDEAPGGPDSRMIGGQVGGEVTVSPQLRFDVSAAYYDYTLLSLAGANSGDIRTNRFAGGRYVSDYDLLDIIGSVTWTGLGDRWPVRLVGDYVHNYGATVGADGFAADLILGRATTKGDWRFSYGYAQTGVDAVLAAFSHDNTGIATNYLQHTLAVDYKLRKGVTLNATYYRYLPNDPAFAGTNDPRDWLDRLRLNLLVGF